MPAGMWESTDQVKSHFFRDRLHILLLVIREFKQINLYFPWNYQKTIHFLMISGEQKLINSFKFPKGQFCKSGTRLKPLQRTSIKLHN